MQTIADVQRAAAAGDAEAQELLAGVLEQAGRLPDAVAWLSRAAEGGRASAKARLGLWRLVGRGVAAAPGAGAAAIVEAAASGDPFALSLAGIVDAGGVGQPRNLPRAMQWLARAAAAGDAGAKAQIALIEAHGQALAAPVARECVSEAPSIQILPGLIPSALCDYVMTLAGPALARGKVVDETGAESVRRVRTNSVVNFGLIDSDVLLEMINNRLAEAAGLPPENAEGLGVLHYAPGEAYAPHVDYIAPTPANTAQLAARGQRVRTVVVYLNDGFEGGATEFPRLGKAFKPPKGSAVMFDNVTPDGAPDPLTLHTGAAPSRGEKWAISKWFRAKALRPGPGQP